ncbi:MAG: GTPase Era [Chloroflexi bacterium]|nr:GTPase Era [Chloroflexota bacterium]
MSAYKAGFVAVVGRPNVGKSALMNALLGQAVSAVSPRAQTTRRNQLGILTLENAQIVFVDTPGLHEARNKLGEFMNAQALAALEDADVFLFLVDATEAPNKEDKLLAKRVADRAGKRPAVLAINKADLVTPQKLERRREEYGALIPSQRMLVMSATERTGLADLMEVLLQVLPEGQAFYPDEQVTDLYERQIAADQIRAAALNLLRDEVPHGIAVRVDRFIERGEKGARIEATLFVERESHKGIVIGEGGKMIKEIGSAARKEIETMSGRKVFLELRVKVKANWRQDENALERLGYSRKEDR